MAEYPREGQAVLYLVLCGTQVYLTLLAALGSLERPGPVALTLRYGSLALVFGLLALGSVQSPLIDLVDYRWWLRAGYTAYGLLCLYAICRYWRALLHLARQRRAAQAEEATT
jgi:hypothetical protein